MRSVLTHRQPQPNAAITLMAIRHLKIASAGSMTSSPRARVRPGAKACSATPYRQVHTLALPLGLTREQRAESTRTVADRACPMIDGSKLPHVWAIHASGSVTPHVHVAMTPR